MRISGGGADLCIFLRSSLGGLVFEGILGFVVGGVGAYEECVIDGIVFDGLWHYVRAGIDPADPDVGA